MYVCEHDGGHMRWLTGGQCEWEEGCAAGMRQAKVQAGLADWGGRGVPP